MPDEYVILESSVASLNGKGEQIVFTRRTDRNEVFIVIRPAEIAILVSAIALRSAAETILDGPDAPQS